jgi:hypothetical protein
VEYSTGERELYDLTNDPFELTNLAGQGDYAAQQNVLAARLVELLAENPVRRPTPSPSTSDGSTNP